MCYCAAGECPSMFAMFAKISKYEIFHFFIFPFVRLFICSFVHLFVCSCVHFFICSCVQRHFGRKLKEVRWLVRLLFLSLANSFLLHYFQFFLLAWVVTLYYKDIKQKCNIKKYFNKFLICITLKERI